MKRYLLILFILIIFIFPAKAQRFNVGLLAGVDISDVGGADLTDPDNDFNKFGFTVGGYVNTKINKSTFQMEMAFAQKGSSQPPDSTNNNNFYNLLLDYVDVTLAYRHSLHLNIGKQPSDKFELECGASVGYLFHYSYTVKQIELPIVLNTTDVSAFIGFAYNFSPNFAIDLRYSNSVIPVIKPDAANPYFLYYNSWNDGHNLVFQITFKYTFGKFANTSSSTPSNSDQSSEPK